MAKHTTPMYRAPEMLDTWSNHSIHTGADIWALGCLLYFLCYGRHPFEDSAKLAILNGNYRIPANDVTHTAFHDLIRQMLVVDPTFRPTINQVQEHLASISSAGGFCIINGDGDTELDLELSSLNSPPNIQESASNESLQSSVSATTTSETAVSFTLWNS
jgi:cyclin G-associated kinase